jgi:hypothetical protein
MSLWHFVMHGMYKLGSILSLLPTSDFQFAFYNLFYIFLSISTWLYCGWIYNWLNNYLSPQTLCYEVCQQLLESMLFSLDAPIFFTNKTDCHDIAKILLKVALNTYKPILFVITSYHIHILYLFFFLQKTDI